MRYFFHTRQGATVIEDREGVSLPSGADLRDEIIEAARGRSANREGIDMADGVFEIADDSGRTVLRVPLAEAVSRVAQNHRLRLARFGR